MPSDRTQIINGKTYVWKPDQTEIENRRYRGEDVPDADWGPGEGPGSWVEASYSSPNGLSPWKILGGMALAGAGGQALASGIPALLGGAGAASGAGAGAGASAASAPSLAGFATGSTLPALGGTAASLAAPAASTALPTMAGLMGAGGAATGGGAAAAGGGGGAAAAGGGSSTIGEILKALAGGTGGQSLKTMLPLVLAQGGMGLLGALLSGGNDQQRSSFEGSGATDPKLMLLNLVRAIYAGGNAAAAKLSAGPTLTATAPRLTSPLAAGWASDPALGDPSKLHYPGMEGLMGAFPQLGPAPAAAGAVPRPGAQLSPTTEGGPASGPRKRRLGT